MSTVINNATIQVFAPGDEEEAQAALTRVLYDPGETWAVIPGDELEAVGEHIWGATTSSPQAHGRPVPAHVYVDNSAGAAPRAAIKALLDVGVDVTVGTATDGEGPVGHTSFIVTNTGHVLIRSGDLVVWALEPRLVNLLVAQYRRLEWLAWTHEEKTQVAKEPPATVASARSVHPEYAGKKKRPTGDDSIPDDVNVAAEAPVA